MCLSRAVISSTVISTFLNKAQKARKKQENLFLASCFIWPAATKMTDKKGINDSVKIKDEIIDIQITHSLGTRLYSTIHVIICIP